MKSSLSKTLVLVLAIVLSACNVGTSSGSSVETEVPATEPAPTSVPATEAPATEAPIIHKTIPTQPEDNIGNASDNDETNSYEDRNVRFGDDFIRNRFERPFTTEMGEYLPEIDVVSFSIGEDDNFFYVSMLLGGLNTTGQAPAGHYAIEVDGNIDGRGEFLIVANPPFGSEWSTDGVQIFTDLNSDIGGKNPIRRDDAYAGDGYETLAFDSGKGSDPDLGWARFVNGETPSLEIAFNKVVFPSTPSFMWSVWASATPFDPTKFNLHDTTTAEAAGSPDKQNDLYPIKTVSGIDNSCRVPVGFQATGTEPLGCPVAGVEEPEAPSGDPGAPANICDLYPLICNPIAIKIPIEIVP